MFGKKKKSGKPKLDDGAKAAVMASATGAGGSGACAAGSAVGGAQLLSQALEKYNKRMRRVCKAGGILVGIGVALLITGSLLVHFFGAYVRISSWKRVPGISGIVVLLVSLLVLGIGVVLLVWAYHLLKNREKDSAPLINLQSPQPGSLPSSAYPRQGEVADAVAIDPPAGQEEAAPLQPKEPTAPPTAEVLA